jgi:hypothetical protein
MVSTLKRAMSALGQRLGEVKPGLTLNSKGYVDDWQHNLLSGTNPQWFEAELKEGDGNELAGKFRAAHSSSALAVNTFARFKTACSKLSLANWGGCEWFRFEVKCPAGIIRKDGRQSPPNLDLLARGAPFVLGDESKCSVLGIESKCTEHLKTRNPKFSPAYNDQIKGDDARRKSTWFELMQQIRVTDYCQLDAAQLIKHAFGLAHCFAKCKLTLLYLYWEPKNADEFLEFKNHREEVKRFEGEVNGSLP